MKCTSIFIFAAVLLAVCFPAYALPPVRPALPSVAHADTEVVTNVPFAAWQEHVGKFTFTLACNATASNNVQVAFGKDADGDGELSLAESELIAGWPAQVVNYTNKTQFIFRISKGYLDINDDLVNDYVEPENLRVPFRNMVYIGDSDTDIPCKKLVNANGGYSIGVFNSDLGETAKQRVHKMFLEKRIGYFCLADYTVKSPLDILLKNIIRLTAIRSQIEQIHLECEKDTYLRKRDRDLAKAVDTLVRVRSYASTDWNGLMSNPEILINAIGASGDLHDGLFYRAIMEQAQQCNPAVIENVDCSDDER